MKLEPQGQPRNAYAWMDAFRAIASILVAISHVRDIMVRDARPSDDVASKAFYFVTGFGHIGVVVFFVLSGYWITKSVMNRVDKPGFWHNYLIDRVSRLWVVLLPVLLIGGTLDWLGTHFWEFPNYMGESGAHSVPSGVKDSLGWAQWAAGPFFLAAIFVSPLGSNGPLWSLSFEFWYYIWFPALVIVILRRRLTPAVLFLGVGVFSASLSFGFISWLVGAGLHLSLKSLAQTGRPHLDRIGLATTFLLLSILLGVGRVLQSEWFDPLLALSFGLLLLFLCRTNLGFPSFMSPLGNFGSTGSFSLYALHFPLAMAAVGWLYGGIRREPSPTAMIETGLLTLALVCIAWIFARGTEAKTDMIRSALKGKLTKWVRTAEA